MKWKAPKKIEKIAEDPLAISSEPEIALKEAMKNKVKAGKEWSDKSVSLLIEEVVKTYAAYGDLEHLEGKDLPSPSAVIGILDDLMAVLFPNFFGDAMLTKVNIHYFLGNILHSLHGRLMLEVERSLKYVCRKIKECPTDICQSRAQAISKELLECIPEVRNLLAGDVRAAFSGDPAARSLEEVILGYPCVYAIATYRVSHELYRRGVPIIPRIMSEHAHSKTGIDIHPGAVIGKNFFIDHGTGVVIGETTEIGDNVKIYQGVTLGGISLPTGEVSKFRNKKRHPTIKDNVIIYSGATILGGKTVLGESSVIGGNVWITSSIPPGTIVTTTPGKLSYKTNQHNTQSSVRKET